jgi:hypothetical protein
MGLDLTPLDKYAATAVEFFWGTRVDAAMKQQEGGKSDQGARAEVTGGHNMDGFMMLLVELAKANGMPDADIFTAASVVTLPGFFRPTKRWDLVIVSAKRLVAAIELKSQVGPSFGNNFNNRTEEAIGAAHDFWTTFREGAFGEGPRPKAVPRLAHPGRRLREVTRTGTMSRCSPLRRLPRVRRSILPPALRHPLSKTGAGEPVHPRGARHRRA